MKDVQPSAEDAAKRETDVRKVADTAQELVSIDRSSFERSDLDRVGCALRRRTLRPPGLGASEAAKEAALVLMEYYVPTPKGPPVPAVPSALGSKKQWPAGSARPWLCQPFPIFRGHFVFSYIPS